MIVVGSGMTSRNIDFLYLVYLKICQWGWLKYEYIQAILEPVRCIAFLITFIVCMIWIFNVVEFAKC